MEVRLLADVNQGQGDHLAIEMEYGYQDTCKLLKQQLGLSFLIDLA